MPYLGMSKVNKISKKVNKQIKEARKWQEQRNTSI